MSAADNARKLFAVVLTGQALLSPFILVLLWRVLETDRVLTVAFITCTLLNVVLAFGLWRPSHWVPWAVLAWLAGGVVWFAVFAAYSGFEPSPVDVLLLAAFVAFAVWLARALWRSGRGTTNRSDA
jgi:hypothetical protein